MHIKLSRCQKNILCVTSMTCKGQNSYSSGALHTHVFLSAMASSSCSSKQHHHLCSHQSWSFPSRSDGHIAWCFLWSSARWHCSPSCPSPHAESVPAIFSAQWDLLSTLPSSHQPWRDRCVAPLLWIYVIYNLQHYTMVVWRQKMT